jgi:histone H3/H4
MTQDWRNCSVCKKTILLGSLYQKCSISSCRKVAFCSVDCWDIHQGVMGHKSSYAEEERAPHSLEEQKPRRRIVASNTSQSKSMVSNKEVLIVVSKLKSYVKESCDMNTSGDVADTLSDYVRAIVDQASINARAEGRKTLMGRDFKNISI